MRERNNAFSRRGARNRSGTKMIRTFAWLLAFGVLSLASCGSPKVATQHDVAVEPKASSCNIASASPWINTWFAAWELTSQHILHLPDAPAPNVVFFDSTCVYTTSKVTAPNLAAVLGPALCGKPLWWYAVAHKDTITTPKGDRIPIGLMSFTAGDQKIGPFFVMAAPSYWERKMKRDDPYGFTAVFIHEFTHTRQLRGMASVIGPIDSTWSYPEELDDDAVQTHFSADSVYVKAYLAERDLLYKAANADSLSECRALAKQALEMIRSRHARWFTGDKAVFATLDDTWLSMEGAAQWAAVAWLSHPDGGKMTKDAAIAKMVGKSRWWAQDESLAVFLVVDRLLPEWPTLIFGPTSMGASELLETAIYP